MRTTNEIAALFRLIDDPDYEVYDTVANKLLHYGKEIIPNLEQLWEVTADEDVQERIAQLIHRVHFMDLQQEFLEWRNSKNPELLRGAILIARYQYPDLNVASLLTQFDQMRRNIWLELNNYLTPLEQINVFNSILYNYYKLQGHELTDRKPEYYYINKVLENKQGNCYSIGVLYLSLCELLDIPIFAVDIPRQFIFAYFDTLQNFFSFDNAVTRQISFYIDPINGMAYTQNDVDNYLKKTKVPAKSDFFSPQSTIRVICRMIEDLSLSYRYNQDDFRANELQHLANVLK